MNRKKILGLIIFCIFFMAIILPVFAQEKPDDKDWEKGRITAVGKDFIKIDKKRYNVSQDVKITGEHGDDLGSDLKNLRGADEIMFRLSNDNIIEIRILRLTSCLWLIEG